MPVAQAKSARSTSASPRFGGPRPPPEASSQAPTSDTKPAPTTIARGRGAGRRPDNEGGQHDIAGGEEAGVGGARRLDPRLLQGRAEEEREADHEREAPFVAARRMRLAAEFPERERRQRCGRNSETRSDEGERRHGRRGVFLRDKGHAPQEGGGEEQAVRAEATHAVSDGGMPHALRPARSRSACRRSPSGAGTAPACRARRFSGSRRPARARPWP